MKSDTEQLLELGAIFAGLSLLAVGGGTAVLPQMKHEVVFGQQWMSTSQFNDYYAIGQFVPGPNMLMVALIGKHVAGWGGAALVTVAFFAPFCTLMYFAAKIWDRLAGAPWRESVRAGLAPISIGLMLSGVYAVGHGAITATLPALIAVSVALLVLFTKTSPALLMLLGGVAGYFFLS